MYVCTLYLCKCAPAECFIFPSRRERIYKRARKNVVSRAVDHAGQPKKNKEETTRKPQSCCIKKIKKSGKESSSSSSLFLQCLCCYYYYTSTEHSRHNILLTDNYIFKKYYNLNEYDYSM